MNKNIANNFFNLISLASFGLTAYDFVKSRITNNQNDILEMSKQYLELSKKNDVLRDKLESCDKTIEYNANKIEDLSNNCVNLSNENSELKKEAVSFIEKRFELYDSVNMVNDLMKKVIKSKDIFAEHKLPKIKDLLSINEERIYAFIDNANKGNIIQDKLKQINPNIGGNNFNINSTFDNIYSYINEFSKFLDTLTIEQKFSLLHILGAISILLSLYSILGVFYSNFFIEYFKLEQKYPKIAVFFKLRRKFQQFYLLINISIIAFIVLVEIYINYLMLIG